MIAFDTNALVRLLTEDDEKQAEIVQAVVKDSERKGSDILILTEVLIETVWVLESVYECTRTEIADSLEAITDAPVYYLPDNPIVRKVVSQYRKKGDFADLIITEKAKTRNAEMLLSFDRKLQKMFPDFVSGKLNVLSNRNKKTSLPKE